MARSSAFIGGEAFAPRSHVMFGSLDFLATATGELRLASPDVPITMGTRPTRSKAKKQRLKGRDAALTSTMTTSRRRRQKPRL
jgi:hypothetical protein